MRFYNYASNLSQMAQIYQLDKFSLNLLEIAEIIGVVKATAFGLGQIILNEI
ncbi:MAG: hypothetical protein MR902_07075 [Campylobacter sp.]|nr:hypothetical protein [Campylobacter sp.]